MIQRWENNHIKTKHLYIIKYLTCWKAIVSFCMPHFWIVQWKTMKTLKYKDKYVEILIESKFYWLSYNTSDEREWLYLRFPSLFPFWSKLFEFAFLLAVKEGPAWMAVLATYKLNVTKIYSKIILKINRFLSSFKIFSVDW